MNYFQVVQVFVRIPTGSLSGRRQQHGTQLEPEARLAYETRFDRVMQALVMRDGPYSASLDGVTLDGDVVLEVKCPYRGRESKLWRAAERGEVPAHYGWQIQHQLMVSGARVAHLWVYAEGQGLLVEVDRDDTAIDELRIAWDAFQVCLDTDSAPPLREADTVERVDRDWLDAAETFLTLKIAAETAAANLDAAREALCGMTSHPRERGGEVSVTRFWKSGSVNYKAVPALRGVDLTPFRGKAREEVRVTG